MRRISDRVLTRNEERWCAFAGRTSDRYDAPPSRLTVRLVWAYDTIEDWWFNRWGRSRWEPSAVTLATMARRLSPVGAPPGGTRRQRRLARTRAIQRARRLWGPDLGLSEMPF